MDNILTRTRSSHPNEFCKYEVVKISKGVPKNMLKAWNFNKSEVQDSCLDNNFRTRILENANRYILSIIDLMVGL